MSSYPRGRHVLSDAKLRLDRIPVEQGVLVVEGPDDKRVLGEHVLDRRQIVVAGGRRLLLNAHELAHGESENRLLFLTDCDYEIAAGTLHGAVDLVITQHADLEADLLFAGAMGRIVGEVLANIEGNEELRILSDEVLSRAIAMAEPIGRMRKVARLREIEIDVVDLRYQRARAPHTLAVDVRRLAQMVVQRSPRCDLSADELHELATSVDGGELVCNGHDLVAAIQSVLHEDYGVDVARLGGALTLLHMAADRTLLARCEILGRIERWEKHSGRKLLRAV